MARRRRGDRRISPDHVRPDSHARGSLVRGSCIEKGRPLASNQNGGYVGFLRCPGLSGSCGHPESCYIKENVTVLFFLSKIIRSAVSPKIPCDLRFNRIPNNSQEHFESVEALNISSHGLNVGFSEISKEPKTGWKVQSVGDSRLKVRVPLARTGEFWRRRHQRAIRRNCGFASHDRREPCQRKKTSVTYPRKVAIPFEPTIPLHKL
jgi:hypothetical protein